MPCPALDLSNIVVRSATIQVFTVIPDGGAEVVSEI
jgi:hypothetical protein